jgi:hypothetical protein
MCLVHQNGQFADSYPVRELNKKFCKLVKTLQTDLQQFASWRVCQLDGTYIKE